MLKKWIFLLLSVWYMTSVFACKPHRYVELIFYPGDYSITEEHSEVLTKTLQHFQPLEKAQINMVLVIGSASRDESLSNEGRRMISIRRAIAVRDWLNEHGIPNSKLYYEGQGSEHEDVTTGKSWRKVEVEFEIIPFPNPCKPPEMLLFPTKSVGTSVSP